MGKEQNLLSIQVKLKSIITAFSLAFYIIFFFFFNKVVIMFSIILLFQPVSSTSNCFSLVILKHFYSLSLDSFCCVVFCCVKTGGYEKIIFGTGIKMIVQSRKFIAFWQVLFDKFVFGLKLCLEIRISFRKYSQSEKKLSLEIFEMMFLDVWMWDWRRSFLEKAHNY